ncbi:MAG: M23 family metallopeptidase [Patescibacteria group bacterium]
MRMFGRGRSHTLFKGLIAKNAQVGKFSWKKLAFPVLVFLIFPGAVAYASLIFLSPHSDFLEVSMQKKDLNSQNIVLPSSLSSVEFSQKDILSNVSTVAGSALFADLGPSGGLANVNSDWYDNGQISIYVVREGDTSSSVAKMFDVSVSTVVWANNLSRAAELQIGQTLVILPISGVQYTVKNGDTIVSIAKKFKGDPDEIRSYNGILGDKLDIGLVIIIPDGVSSVPAPALSGRLRAASGPSYDGYYAAPLPAGYRKTQGLHGYNGVDLALYRGAPVLSAAGGQVIVARASGYNGGYGKYVVVAHSNGTQTVYSHLDSVAVKAGDVMASGELLGTVGSTGRSTGPHLHFEVRGAKNPF